ncbi:DUF2271 domain-containing protein [uncultured Sphingomonas sp.]|uniref:DUF2271 domain-containing protein n=1 Tax=uncultured Sphingomonas sp. TaxID=158754 RepID=UPI0025ECCFD5|nr:DUF2271 domain-containing protein [uncultured Sphingomonas sp.]
MHKAPLLIAGLIAAPASAAGTLTVTIPRLAVAEYHRPYVAGWIEPAGGGAAQTLFVWYDVKKTGGEPGTKWLADLRTWWRKGGRGMHLPADGVSGATRPAGVHKLTLPDGIKPGQYTLYVEAARETGGREIVSTPLSVPLKPASAAGKAELGAITLSPR